MLRASQTGSMPGQDEPVRNPWVRPHLSEEPLSTIKYILFLPMAPIGQHQHLHEHHEPLYFCRC